MNITAIKSPPPVMMLVTTTASMTMVVSFITLLAVLIQCLSALAAEYQVAESQLRDLVVTDPMTGLPNYRRLVEVLTEEITRANRTDSTFAVVFHPCAR